MKHRRRISDGRQRYAAENEVLRDHVLWTGTGHGVGSLRRFLRDAKHPLINKVSHSRVRRRGTWDSSLSRNDTEKSMT
jgi:hypothetical protein